MKKELIECFRNNAKLICKNALLRARPGNNQSSSSYQFQSNRGYLQARVKLHRQSSTFSYNPYMTPRPIDINSINDNSLHKFPPNTISLYISHRLLFFDPSQEGYTNSCYGSKQLCNCEFQLHINLEILVFNVIQPLHLGIIHVKNHE